MNRAEHLAWCKERALDYVDRGDIVNALASLRSDLGKHPDTEDLTSIADLLGLPIAMSGDIREMRRFIEGFQ